MNNRLRAVLIGIVLCGVSMLSADTWEELGNSNQAVGMAVRAMLVDPNNSSVLYVGGNPGVCKYNGPVGLTWVLWLGW